MTSSPLSTVVVDTGVFGARLTGQDLAFRYRSLLDERAVVLAFATLAELRFGAAIANWGIRKGQRLEAELAQVETIRPGPQVLQTYVTLRTWCVRTGHGLGQKEHEADRWIASSALWLGIPLVTNDRIFLAGDQLEVLTLLEA